MFAKLKLAMTNLRLEGMDSKALDDLMDPLLPASIRNSYRSITGEYISHQKRYRQKFRLPPCTLTVDEFITNLENLGRLQADRNNRMPRNKFGWDDIQSYLGHVGATNANDRLTILGSEVYRRYNRACDEKLDYRKALAKYREAREIQKVRELPEDRKCAYNPSKFRFDPRTNARKPASQRSLGEQSNLCDRSSLGNENTEIVNTPKMPHFSATKIETPVDSQTLTMLKSSACSNKLTQPDPLSPLDLQDPESPESRDQVTRSGISLKGRRSLRKFSK